MTMTALAVKTAATITNAATETWIHIFVISLISPLP